MYKKMRDIYLAKIFISSCNNSIFPVRYNEYISRGNQSLLALGLLKICFYL
jgi:hypothetical protein